MSEASSPAATPPSFSEQRNSSAPPYQRRNRGDRGADAVRILEPMPERFAASTCPPPMLGQIELELARTLSASPGQDKARTLALLDSASRRMHQPETLAEIERLRAASR